MFTNYINPPILIFFTDDDALGFAAIILEYAGENLFIFGGIIL